jgi:glycosyltransferase involved in cell wall biosynthesis
MTAAFHFNPPTLADWILGALVLTSIIICWYHLIRYYGKIKTSKAEPGQLPPVSIVVAAKNETENLKKHIPLWLEQQYPQFEIVIADDGSTDGTSEWLAPLAKDNPRLRYVLLDSEYVKMHGKKIALTLGFKAAQYNHFILTDADCAPSSALWLQKMAIPFSQGTDLVIGAAPLYKIKGFLGQLVSFESLLISLQYLGRSLAGKTYMGVGRNMGYTRKLYDSVSGFSSHHHIPAGDDDLFVQSVTDLAKVSTVIDEDAYTWSSPKLTFKEYLRQKNRHLWVGKFYQSQWKQRLAVLPMAEFVFWTSVIIWFFTTAWWVYPLTALLLKLIPEWIVIGLKSKLLKQGPPIVLYPFWNFFHTFWYLFIGTKAFFSKKPIW